MLLSIWIVYDDIVYYVMSGEGERFSPYLYHPKWQHNPISSVGLRISQTSSLFVSMFSTRKENEDVDTSKWGTMGGSL